MNATKILREITILATMGIGMAACAQMSPGAGGSNALVSGRSPANAESATIMPQSPNSLPVGAEGIGSSPLATTPNSTFDTQE